jgi:uncharacterized protein YndB with AHSA1/START domain
MSRRQGRTTDADDRVVVDIDIAATPSRVFEALTDPAQLSAWWSREETVELITFQMDARPGGSWRCRWRPVVGRPQGDAGEQLARNGFSDYEAHGEVVTIDAPHLIVWSWIANWHRDVSAASTVQWELIPTGSGTRVRMVHSGLSQEPTARRDYGGGWRGVLSLLAAHAHGESH